MTQRYAIVAYSDDPKELPGHIDGDQVWGQEDGNAHVQEGYGKLTREQIETMAKEFYNHLLENKMIHLLYCDEEVEIFIEAQRKAAEFIGLEVEEEK